MELQFISHDELHFDPFNPRLPEHLKGKGEKEVVKWFIADASLIDLIASIAENNFFAGEPVIVVEEKGKKVVIEGNRRLAAVKLLNDPEIAVIYQNTIKELQEEAKKKKNIPNKIPIWIAESRTAVENYLAFRHVTGVKPWPVISKARFVYNIFSKLAPKGITEELFNEIAKDIGNKAVYVKRLVWGYELYQLIQKRNYFGIKEISQEEDFDLALITDAAITHKKIAGFMSFDTSTLAPIKNIDVKNFEKVVNWLYKPLEKTKKPRVPESRYLKILNEVLGSEVAKEKFINSDIDLIDAVEFTQFSYTRFSLLVKKVESSLNNIYDLTESIQEFTKADFEKMGAVQDKTAKIKKAIQPKIIS